MSEPTAKRLHVATVTIEFEFAFMADPAAAEGVASSLVPAVAEGLSSLQDFAEVNVRIAAPYYYQPEGCGAEDMVHDIPRRGPRTASRSWAEVVAEEKAAAEAAVVASQLTIGEIG